MYKQLFYNYEDCEILTGYEHIYPNYETRITSPISGYSNSIQGTQYYSRIKVKRMIDGIEHEFISDLILKDKEAIKFSFLQDRKFSIWYEDTNPKNYFFEF